MARVQLAGFPTDKWADIDTIPVPVTAESSLRLAFQYDPNNATANYHLGLISMLHQDFESASAYLETAYERFPGHRGIIKNLGYSYVWLGEMDKAETLLAQIPEAQHELEVYVWWWDLQGRQDLSRNAFQMASNMDSRSSQP